MTPPTERCPTCDRDGCPRLRYWHTPMNQHPDDITGCLACSAMRDCHAHRVDWRARAIAAEAERSEIVSLVSPSSDQSLPDAVRELCEHAEEIRLAAAQWAKVAPLIERLADDVRRRELIARAEFDRRVSDTVTAMLAATEATP